MHQYELVRNANVSVSVGQMDAHPTVVINVNDKYEHEFDPKSRISKALLISTSEDIQERLSGGTYFFHDKELIDFRDSAYRGFIHTDESVEKLMNILGVNTSDTKMVRRLNTQSHTHMLGRVWNEHSISVPGFQDGGNFSSRLAFTWNPFNQNIKSIFELVRLICTNGMVGLKSFLNSNIPLVNRWEEHLDIATMQIQRKVENKVLERLSKMTNERASVSDLSQIAEHAHHRLTSDKGTNGVERNRLRTIHQIANPAFHLFDYYKPVVFEDTRLADQLPGHLTACDAWNIATELATHTSDGGGSTDTGLQLLANRLLFDAEDTQARSAQAKVPPISQFSDPEQAFFGALNA